MIDRLLSANERFVKTEVEKERELYAQLAKGQSPEVLMVTCSDSRIGPFRVTGSKPGELFVLRNAGNVVPPTDHPGGEGASIEFGVRGLGVKHIVVMGHSQCGAVKGRLAPESANGMPKVQKWVGFVAGAEGTHEDPVQAAVEENVRLQLEHLRAHDSVAEGLKAGKLTLHGWVYDLGTGRISTLETGVAQA